MRRLATIIITGLFLLCMFPMVSLAQEEAVVGSPSAVLSPSPSPEYTLPYPGLLPDNPLYSLKILRDHIVGFLITEPLKKAEFDLLQSDKRLQAGMYLLQKNPMKQQLVFSTVSKGENYFEEAISKTQEAKSQKVLVSDFSDKLLKAAQKHQQVLTGMAQLVSEREEKKQYETLVRRSRLLEKKVEKDILQRQSSSS